MKADTVIGIIGGSGVYDVKGLENTKWTSVESPFGEPSDCLLYTSPSPRDVEESRMPSSA